MEALEARNLMTAMPLGATYEDTGEFLLGRIAVVPVLFESNGQIDRNTQNWTAAEIDAAIEKVRVGVQWWADTLETLDTVHSLEFVVDDTFARTPFDTPYEAIDRRSQEAPTYITPFLRAQGINNATSLDDAMHQFNNGARLRLGTDWAFTIFVIDSSDDADGQFAPGSEFSIAHAFAGGLYVVTPSTRPASTIAHETGHIFWARDEYPGGGSYTDRRGYYNAQNLNAADNPAGAQEISIMRSGNVLQEAYATHYLPASTRAMIGWLDSDGDGIFDVADVPLAFDGEGRYVSERGVFTFSGTAHAVALPNQNSAGTQNDITLNRIDRIQYRVDDGPWQTAVEVNSQSADVSFNLSIPAFQKIELRAIDNTVGVTSPILQTTGTLPLLPANSIAGIAYINQSGEGEIDPAASLLGRVTATLTMNDGSPIFGGAIDPATLPIGPLGGATNGATLGTVGVVLDGRVGINQSGAITSPTLHYYNLQNATWQNAWDAFRQLTVTFEKTVGEVSLTAFATGSRGSHARLEAYDATGNLLSRTTSDKLNAGQSSVITVSDPAGRIASIRAFGHNATTVAFGKIDFGTDASFITGSDGVFRFGSLPDGNYRVELAAERLIYQPQTRTFSVTKLGGIAGPIAAAFERVTSPWQNPLDPFDVDGNGSVRPIDALRIINEISRNGARILTNPSLITLFVDPSNDGAVTPLDALRVINEIARRNRVSGGGDASGEQSTAAVDTVFAMWNPDLKPKKAPLHTQLSTFSGEPIQ